MSESPTTPSQAAPAHGATAPLLEVRDLRVEFDTPRGIVRAVNGLSYVLHEHETLAVLGESGSGKSISAEAVMGIIESPPGFVTGGEARFRGRDVLTLPRAERRRICGDRIAMVFQDALAALNPVVPVGAQIAEVFRVHRDMGKAEAMERAVELLRRVGIPDPVNRARDYPHQFSGGMRQRVMIAEALALDPDVLIADEPTTALDVTVQASILDLLERMQAEVGMGLILITHDLGVAAETADRVAVMYAGTVMETGPVKEVLQHPAHPYTLGLLASLPQRGHEGGKLDPIRGAPPDLVEIPQGCPFHPRCPYAQDRCRTETPPAYTLQGTERSSACHFFEDVLNAR